MKLTKKFIALAMVSAMSISMLAACGQKPAESTPASDAPIKLTVWASQDDQALTSELIESFKAANPDKTFEITLGSVGEGEAKEKYLQDPTAAADVFAFANDQLYDLVNAGGLYEVTRNKDAIVAANSEMSIDSATAQDGKLYAYPMTADNGYFMYYDKSVFTEEDVASFDNMLAVAEKAGKKVFMDVSNGWYIASFFLGNGCQVGTDKDGKAYCDFNNEKGLQAGEAIKAITAHAAFLTGDDNVLKGGFTDGSIAAGVSGTWNAADIKSALGDNYGVAKLPTFTVDGAQVQMSSFAGTKLIGVNSQTANPVEAADLAEWLTNEASQVRRYEVREMGPSNLKAAQNEAVLANEALTALNQQNQFATAQKGVPGGYWSPAEAFGTAMEAKDYSTPIQEMLDSMVAQIIA